MEEKLISDMLKLGCSDKTNAIRTYQVYIDLIDVKKFHNVTYHYSNHLNTMYITANETKNGTDNTYIPISSLENISFNKMEQLLEISNNDRKSVYLAFVAPDSTCVYYRLTDGILPVSEINLEGSRFEKRQKRDKDLNKRKEELRQAAFLNKPL